MQTMIKLRAVKCLAWVVVMVFATPLLAGGALAAVKAPEPPKTIVVFPLDNPSGEVDSRIVTQLGEFVRGGLETSGRYRVVAYSERLPAVQRLVTLQPEKKLISAGPFYGDDQAVSNAVYLSKTMSADMVLIGSVDGYTVSENGAVQMPVTIEVHSAETGKAVQVISVNGKADKAVMPGNADDILPVVKDAGTQIISSITGGNGEETITSSPLGKEGKRTKRSWLGLLLLSLGIGLLAGNSGGGSSSGSSSGGTDLPPGPPVGFN